MSDKESINTILNGLNITVSKIIHLTTMTIYRCYDSPYLHCKSDDDQLSIEHQMFQKIISAFDSNHLSIIGNVNGYHDLNHKLIDLRFCGFLVNFTSPAIVDKEEFIEYWIYDESIEGAYQKAINRAKSS